MRQNELYLQPLVSDLAQSVSEMQSQVPDLAQNESDLKQYVPDIYCIVQKELDIQHKVPDKA